MNYLTKVITYKSIIMLKTLIVEDDYDNRQYLLEAVREIVNNEWTLFEADTKEEAFRIVEKYEPDFDIS